MSRSAGTLVTTNNATFIPPRFMPGYRGYCPTKKYDYGETYGNQTAKHFQDYRSSVLTSSADPYCRGGSFPTTYTHNPDLVISNRTRTQDRWLQAPRYQLSNQNHDRKEELTQFDRLSQSHRDQYKDKTGTLKSINLFSLPVSAQEQFNKNVPFVILSTKYRDDLCLPHLDHVARRRPLLQRAVTVASQRDREMRDCIFEKR